MTTRASALETIARTRQFPIRIPVEQRYPLDLAVRIPELRRLYRESNSSIWDVAQDLDVQAVDTSNYSEVELKAAALMWSRRAWTNFTAISESEATLVRSCVERNRAADLKYVLAARGTERACAADASHRIASRLSSFVMAPGTAELQAMFATEIIRRALDERVDFDAFFIAHFVVLATLERALLELDAAHTTEPTCLATVSRIAVDVARQETAGRIYLAHRLPHLSADHRRGIADNAEVVVQEDLLSGVRCTSYLSLAVPGAEHLRSAEAITASSGLGAAPLEEQQQVVMSTLLSLDDDLAEMGIATTLAPGSY